MIELENLKDALRKTQDESDDKDFEICQLSQENNKRNSQGSIFYTILRVASKQQTKRGRPR